MKEEILLFGVSFFGEHSGSLINDNLSVKMVSLAFTVKFDKGGPT